MSEQQNTAEQWIQVAAGLKNPSMRRLLGAVLSGQGAPEPASKSERKDLERWASIGLLRHDGSGWALDDELLEKTLASASAAKANRSGIRRFFDGHRLQSLPAKPADRHEVVLYLRNAIIGDGEELREEQLNERLRVFHPDVALLRRYMVDHGLLQRAADGTGYRMGTVS
ncbi:DUF2087 domain-containing protein [Glutamicibacter nicotianae]|uniref:DUF2087 domain-containing protein n=1 Tax=Glutamicibacter nicotianae TaxID=37929 RepID=UPI003C2FC39A